MKFNEKKGLSPVIATVLLVALAIVLALIVFLWARSFVAESLTKSGEAVELRCKETGFDAEYDGALKIINRKDIPLYEMNVQKVKAGSVSKGVNLNFDGKQTIANGESASVDVGDVTGSDTLIVTPVILGQNDAGTKKAYTCSSDYSVTVNLPPQ